MSMTMQKEPKHGYVGMVCVTDDYKRRGIGQYLMKLAE